MFTEKKKTREPSRFSLPSAGDESIVDYTEKSSPINDQMQAKQYEIENDLPSGEERAYPESIDQANTSIVAQTLSFKRRNTKEIDIRQYRINLGQYKPPNIVGNNLENISQRFLKHQKEAENKVTRKQRLQRLLNFDHLVQSQFRGIDNQISELKESMARQRDEEKKTAAKHVKFILK